VNAPAASDPAKTGLLCARCDVQDARSAASRSDGPNFASPRRALSAHAPSRPDPQLCFFSDFAVFETLECFRFVVACVLSFDALSFDAMTVDLVAVGLVAVDLLAGALVFCCCAKAGPRAHRS